MDDKIRNYLLELIEFRTREAHEMLKVGYARTQVPAYQKLTDEIQQLVDCMKPANEQFEFPDLDSIIENAKIEGNKDDSVYSKTQLKIAELLEELIEKRNENIQLLADFANFKKRTAKEKQDLVNVANKDLLLKLISVVDDFDRVIAIYDKQSDEDKLYKVYDVDPIEAGIRMSYENLIKFLASEGCQKIECNVGDKFNVDLHDAIGSREIKLNESFAENDIVWIYQSGWKLNGNVIRHTKVIIGK